MSNTSNKYKKALLEIQSLCLFHIGDKHELSVEIQNIVGKALKGSKRT